MIYRGENYLNGAYFSPSPIRDTRRWRMILGEDGSRYWSGNTTQQLRRAGLNVIRYCRFQLAGDDYASGTQFSQADLTTLQNYWTDVLGISNLDDESGGAFIHTASPTTSANRWPWPMSGYTNHRARFAQGNWLEFLFGKDATGIRSTDGQPGDIFPRVMWEKDIKYLFHDNFWSVTLSGYSGSNPEELRYATIGNYEQAWFEYSEV
ncbi:MAG: hypothetical protein FJ135_12680, partial [Deltaproteobacteria bacterium]|nr:hypothetical protein [Deltaproteobacteria bacterium]